MILRNKHDENGAIIGVGVKNAGDARFTSYYYAKNLQGDVVAIYRSDYTEAKGYYPTLVASYEYDPWGKVMRVKGPAGTTLSLSAYPNHIAHVNPIRYRGYYYDNETGFYYLQSRYYDPAICRFINADKVDGLGANSDLISINLFAYCGNNPISRIDSNGHFWEALAIGFVAGVVGQYVGDVIGNIKSGKTGLDILKPTSKPSDYLASGVGGAIAAIPGLSFAGTVAVGAVGNVVSDGLKGNINSWGDLKKSALRGAAANGIGYGVAKGMAALKVKQIGNIPRSSRKVYLRDSFYCNSQVNANINLKTFANSSLAENIRIVEKQVAVFRSGFYSTATSTFAALF